MRRTFTRRNGSKFELDVEIDFDKLSREIALKMASGGKKRSTRCGGSIVATIKELPS